MGAEWVCIPLLGANPASASKFYSHTGNHCEIAQGLRTPHDTLVRATETLENEESQPV